MFELRELNEYTVKPLLRTVPGIAEVNESGGYERQFVIQPRPEDLERSGMTFSELADVIAANVENAGGGIISRGGDQLSIRAVTRANTLEDIANLPVKFAAGVKPLLVKNLADVSYGSRIRTGAATVDGQETVIGAAMLLTGENSREVAGRVKGRLAEIEEKLPDDIQRLMGYRHGAYALGYIDDVRVEGLERFDLAGILVIAVLFALLGNWRAALIVTAAIPLSFLFALSGMVKLGVSGNLMSLGAVDFGLIIDGAVVIVENAVRQVGIRQRELGRRLTSEERLQVVLAASKQVANPIFFGVVIITIVYIPILALTGIEGKMFHPMAVTVMLALTGALIIALTLMPVLCSFLLRGRIGESDNLLICVAKAIYQPVLRVALASRWIVVIASIASALNLCRGLMKDQSPWCFTNRLRRAWRNRSASTANWKTHCGASSPKSRGYSHAPAQTTSPPIQCRPAKAMFSFPTSRSTSGRKRAAVRGTKPNSILRSVP